MTDDFDTIESDPYCAHWVSIFDGWRGDENGHEYHCARCGHSCRSHPVLWGAQCQECDCVRFVDPPGVEVENGTPYPPDVTP